MGDLKNYFVNKSNSIENRYDNKMVKISWGGYYNLKEKNNKKYKTNACVENA